MTRGARGAVEEHADKLYYEHLGWSSTSLTGILGVHLAVDSIVALQSSVVRSLVVVGREYGNRIRQGWGRALSHTCGTRVRSQSF